MKMKHLIIVSLLLAVLTIGAVSASQDIAVDDGLATSDVAEDPIEEVAADEAIEESVDSESALEIEPSDFNVKIKDSVYLNDENAVAINYTAPVGAKGFVYFYLDEKGYASHSEYYEEEVTEAQNVNISLNDLSIVETGTYNVTVKYLPLPYDGSELILATGKLNVFKNYTKDDFSIDWKDTVTDKTDHVVNIWNYPAEGTLIVSVNGTSRFTKKITDTTNDDIYVYLSNLNITSNNQYSVSAKYIVNSTSQEIDLGQKNVVVNVDWSEEEPDEYIDIYSSVDFSVQDSSFIRVNDYMDYLNGTISIYIGGNLKLTKKISDIEERNYVYFTVNDLKVYNNIAAGSHNVKVVYMKNGVEEHSVEKTVKFEVYPDIDYSGQIGLGEKENIIITLPKGTTGTVTVYDGVKKYDEDGDYYYVKGPLYKTVNIVDGVATVPLDSLPAGEHRLFINISSNVYTSESYENIWIDVRQNTPGIAVSVTPEIIVGSNVVVTYNGPQSYDKVVIYLDGKEIISKAPITGVLSETISGLSVGQHKIKVLYDDGVNFYSNTFIVNVKVAQFPKADTIKLTLKKVKVKKSAKKLVLTATLKINGKAKKGLKIIFKFNGKKFTAKTNKKGVAKVTIKKKFLKKLKVGKKVKIQATYGKVTKKLTLKVKK